MIQKYVLFDCDLNIALHGYDYKPTKENFDFWIMRGFNNLIVKEEY